MRRMYSLTGVLARTDFKLRYAGSALGIFWMAAKPLALFAVLYFAFSYVMKLGAGVDQYPLQLLLAIVLWSFFAETTISCTSVLVSRADMIRKISFPRIVLPLSVSGTAFLAMSINLLIVLGICIVAGVRPSADWLLLVPLVIELAALSIGVGLVLSAAFVLFRDVGQIWEVGMQLLFYATPIIFPIALVPDNLRVLVLSNPLAQIIQDARGAVIDPSSGTGLGSLSTVERLIPFMIVILVAGIGYWWFQRMSDRVAELV